MIYAFIAICLFGKALADVPTDDCPKVDRMQDFNRTALFGWWYEVKLESNAKEDPCAAINFVSENDIVLYLEASLNETVWEAFNDNHTAINITADDFYVDLSYNMSVNDPDAYQSTDLILNTDYTSYVILYHCGASNLLLSEPFLRVYTREILPDKKVLDTVDNIIKEKNLTHFELVDHRKKCELPTWITSHQWESSDFF